MLASPIMRLRHSFPALLRKLAHRWRPQQHLEIRGGKWTAEHEPLREGAAHFPKQVRLLIGLYAFRDRLQAEVADQRHDRADELCMAAVCSHLAYEAPIHLDAVDRQPAEVRQR